MSSERASLPFVGGNGERVANSADAIRASAPPFLPDIQMTRSLLESSETKTRAANPLEIRGMSEGSTIRDRRGAAGASYGPEIGLEAAILSLLHPLALSFNPSRRNARCDFPTAMYAGLYVTRSARLVRERRVLFPLSIYCGATEAAGERERERERVSEEERAPSREGWRADEREGERERERERERKRAAADDYSPHVSDKVLPRCHRRAGC